MVIYVDILFLNNTLMTYAIMWSVARILGYKSNWWRLLLAAIAGTCYTFIIIYTDTIFLHGFFTVIWHIILNIVTALIMTYISFGKLSIVKFTKAIAFLYLSSFICIGATLSILYIFGIKRINDNKTYIFLTIGFFVLLILGHKGWKIFHSYITPANLLVPVSIYMKNKKVIVKGLVDTGNSLNDPITGAPVIITEFKYVLTLFPSELHSQLTGNKGGITNLVNAFAENDMGDRVRILPFSDLGQEHGMLVGFRPDKVEIICKNKKIKKENISLALTDRILDDGDDYQALVNPRILS